MTDALPSLNEKCAECGHIYGLHYRSFDGEHDGCAYWEDMTDSYDCPHCNCGGFKS